MPKDSSNAATDSRPDFFELCSRADGREDHDVLSYKIETSSIVRCLSPQQVPLTVLLGMKGVGKSTAFKIMTSEARPGFIVAGFAPGSERFKRLPNVQPGLFRERFLALFLIAALALLDESDAVKSGDKKGLSAIVDPLKPILRTLQGTVTEGRSRIKGGSAFGFGLSFDLSEDEEKKFEKFDRVTARKKLQSLADKGIAIRLFVDDPEQTLPLGEQGQNSLIGLILAANEINVNFRGVAGVTVLLKTHIYHKISSNEELANIFPAQRDVLSWTEDELIEAVENRLSFSDTRYGDIFSFDKAEMKNKIVSELRNGPRDLFAWIAMAAQVARGIKLNLGHFFATKKEVGEFSMKQISTAYADTVPNSPRLLKLVFDRNKQFNWEALIKRISDLRTNNREFIELSEKNILEQSSDYAKFFLDAGALQLVTKNQTAEPFAKSYHESGEITDQTKVRMQPLLVAALFG